MNIRLYIYTSVLLFLLIAAICVHAEEDRLVRVFICNYSEESIDVTLDGFLVCHLMPGECSKQYLTQDQAYDLCTVCKSDGEECYSIAITKENQEIQIYED